MTVLLDRWQFGVTITYHFLFVPLTIGLAFLVAIMQVLAYRRKDAVWERLTRFFGTLFLINFAGTRPDHRRSDGDHRHSRPVGHDPRTPGDRAVPRSRTRPGPAPPGTGVGPPGARPMTWRRLPGLDRPARRRVLVAVGVGLAGELAALGLLATGAWLLLSASLRPPILLLSIAIGAVQLFSFLRGSARYAERLASHNLGLGLQAGVRSWLYRRLEQLLPAGCREGTGATCWPA